jgi:transposase-like protein
VEDSLSASVDDLHGFSDAIQFIFPKTRVKRCVIY